MSIGRNACKCPGHSTVGKKCPGLKGPKEYRLLSKTLDRFPRNDLEVSFGITYGDDGVFPQPTSLLGGDGKVNVFKDDAVVRVSPVEIKHLSGIQEYSVSFISGVRSDGRRAVRRASRSDPLKKGGDRAYF